MHAMMNAQPSCCAFIMARMSQASVVKSIHHASPQQLFNEGPSQNSELSTSENYQKDIWAIGQNKTQIEPMTGINPHEPN
ncbi:hypothetical protein [Noviherbaspirillum aerium]|uniref:hypothetical protein n=1 Tax=Noviherbaspirillum aerium TaxID=2588497 RepID=UPI00124BF6BE|nr:hypothetical protein [Noviherbaspirillum aerium]